jgi:hypothetical protein
MSVEIDHRKAPEGPSESLLEGVIEQDIEQLEEDIEILEELVDLEEWAKAHRKPKRAKSYRIRIDRERFVVHVHSMTGREILALVGKTPETYLLSEKLKGGHFEPVGADQVVEFHRHEIERFQTLALDATEG